MMSVLYRCKACGREYSDRQRFIEHLVDDHLDRLRSYLENKVVVAGCLGKGCKALHEVKDLTPSSPCRMCGYPIGRWAYRWAAGFIAFVDAAEQ